MKNIKTRAIAASLSALMAVSALGFTSASAVEISNINASPVAMAPTINPDYDEECAAYKDAKNYLENLEYTSEIISSVLYEPSVMLPSGPCYDPGCGPAIITPNKDTDPDYNTKIEAYNKVKSYLESLNYEYNIIYNVTINPTLVVYHPIIL